MKFMNIKRLLAVGLLCSFLLPLTASAQVSFKRTEKEDRFQYEINAGETVTQEIYVLNLRDEPINVEVYATDGTLTSNGAFTVQSKNEDQRALGKWIEFMDDTIMELEGMEERLVEFTIAVPETVTPGVYGGGLSVTPVVVRSDEESSGAGAIVSTRVVQPLYVEVPGEKISQYSWDSYAYTGGKEHNFNFRFQNNGNTIIKIKGEVIITDLLGNSFRVPIREVTLLQDSEASAKAEWKEKPFVGFYTAKANLTFSELDIRQNDFVQINNETRELRFNVIPWTFILILLALILALIGFYINRKGAHDRYLKKCRKYTVKEGDTIKSLASQYNIGWQKLAKLNKIEAPYELNKGQVILVPPKK